MSAAQRRWSHVPIPLRLDRLGPRSWRAALPWRVTGTIDLEAYYPQLLARPAPRFAVWIVTPQGKESQESAAAPSARAAQVLLARGEKRIVMPEWADHVRPLGHDQAVAVQQIADLKAAAHGSEDTAAAIHQVMDESGLTPWEVDEIDSVVNHAASRYQADLRTQGLDAAEDNLAAAERNYAAPRSVSFTQV